MGRYVVQPGDHAGTIAEKVLGDPQRWQELQLPQGQPIPSEKLLTPGTVVIYPDPPPPPAPAQPGSQYVPSPRPEAPVAPWLEPGVYEMILDQYGPGMAAYARHGEIGSILADAAKHRLDRNRLEGLLQQTNWWKQQKDSEREWELLRLENEGEWRARLDAQMGRTRDYSRKLGITLDEEIIKQISDDALALKWDDSQLTDIIVGYFRPNANTTEPLGQLGVDMGSIKARADQYLLDVSDEEAANFAKRIAMGEMTIETMDVVFRTRAKQRFQGQADAIDAGVLPQDIYAEQRNAIARTLEVSPYQVDLRDPKWQPVLEFIDEKGNRRSMTTSESMAHARKQDEWWGTRNAAEKAANLEVFTMQQLGVFPGAA